MNATNGVQIKADTLRGRDLDEVENILFILGERIKINGWTYHSGCWGGISGSLTDEELNKALRDRAEIKYTTIWVELCFCDNEPKVVLSSRLETIRNDKPLYRTDIRTDDIFYLSDPHCFDKINEWLSIVQ